MSLMNDMDAALVALDGGSGGMATLTDEHEDEHDSWAYDSDYLSCLVDVPEEEEDHDHEEEEHDEGHDEHYNEGALDAVALDDNCSFYNQKSVELKHVVDDTQLFGFERSNVIGSWVLSTQLTYNQDVSLTPCLR